jgi:hypothetical protein
MFWTEGHLKSTTIAALMLGLGACDVYRPRSSWVRLPSSRGPDCTDSTWVCPGWKDLEFDRQTIYGRGVILFVTVRVIDRSFSQRFQAFHRDARRP